MTGAGPTEGSSFDGRPLSWNDRERQRSRRPVETWEVPHLEALGAGVLQLRTIARMSRSMVAGPTVVSASTLKRIEGGTSRTRRSTLTRIAEAMVDDAGSWGLDLGDVETIVSGWCTMAGPALAPESQYAERVAKRRERRARLQARRERRKAELREATSEQARELAKELAIPMAWQIADEESARRRKSSEYQQRVRRERSIDLGRREYELAARLEALERRERSLARREEESRREPTERAALEQPAASPPSNSGPTSAPGPAVRVQVPRPPKPPRVPRWVSG